MKLALARGTNNADAPLGSGWFFRMRTWFAALPIGRAVAESKPVDMPLALNAQCDSATVLQFPIRGDALLVKLAETLRGRIAETPEQTSRFDLSLTRAPRLRLIIDKAAFVEFDVVRTAFSMVVDVEPGTQLTLDTSDFDTLVRFVVEYIRDKRTEFSEPEAGA